MDTTRVDSPSLAAALAAITRPSAVGSSRSKNGHIRKRRWIDAASTLCVLLLTGCVSCPLCDLNDAIARNDTAKADRILKSGPLNDCDAVTAAISKSNGSMLERYTTSVSIANCHMLGPYDPTVLMISSGLGYMEGVQFLITRGAQINTEDKEGWTAVDWAIYKRQLRIAEYLISRGGTQARTADDYVARHDAEIAQIAAINAAYATQMQQQDADNAAFMQAMQGVIQAAQARGGQPSVAPPYVSQATPVAAAPPTYVQHQNGSAANGDGGGQFDRGLVSCITLGADSSGYYFQNNCGVPANILFACVDAATGNIEAPGNVNPQPGQKSAAACFLPRSKTLWVACPNNDGIFGADGHSIWQPGGPYTCKRVWGHGL